MCVSAEILVRIHSVLWYSEVATTLFFPPLNKNCESCIVSSGNLYFVYFKTLKAH